jgi:hypothetical protein
MSEETTTALLGEGTFTMVQVPPEQIHLEQPQKKNINSASFRIDGHGLL